MNFSEQLQSILKNYRERIIARAMRGSLVNCTPSARTAKRIDLRRFGRHQTTLPSSILKHLLSQKQAPISFTLPVNPDPEKGISTELGEQNRVLLGQLDRMRQQADRVRREGGLNTLYVAYPLLRIEDVNARTETTKINLLPVYLWPITLAVSNRLQGNITLHYGHRTKQAEGQKKEQEELSPVEFNPILPKWLELRYGLLPDRDKILEEINSQTFTPEKVLHCAQKALEGLQNLKLLSQEENLASIPDSKTLLPNQHPHIYGSAMIGLFDSLYQSVINDYFHLESQKIEGTAAEIFLALKIVEKEETPTLQPPEEDQYFVTDADRSQKRAVFAARTEPGLAIQGPPGTGKSQTIVNIIVDNLAHGQRTLVVCQKKAALEVVAKRLAKVGLSDLFSMVTDPSSDRQPIIRNIREQVETRTKERHFINVHETREKRNEVIRKIQSVERELEEYNGALWNPISPGKPSYRKILAKLGANKKNGQLIPIVESLQPLLEPMSMKEVEDIAGEVEQIAEVWGQARINWNPWRHALEINLDEDAVRLTQCLNKLRELEIQRSTHANNYPNILRNINSDTLAQWLGHWKAVPPPDVDRLNWASYWTQCHDNMGSERAAEILPKLRRIQICLTELTHRHGSLPLIPHLANLSIQEIQQSRQNATDVKSKKTGWFYWFNTTFRHGMSAMKGLAIRFNLKMDDSLVDSVITHTEHLEAGYAVHAELNNMFSEANISEALNPTDPMQMLGVCQKYLQEFERAESLCTILKQCPYSNVYNDLKYGLKPEILSDYLHRMEETINRQELQCAVSNAIHPLGVFLEQSYIADLQEKLSREEDILPQIQQLIDTQSLIPAALRFSFRFSRLSQTAVQILKCLEVEENKEDFTQIESISERWRMIIISSAMQIWRRAHESKNRILRQLTPKDYQQYLDQLKNLDTEKIKLNKMLISHMLKRDNIAPIKEWTRMLPLTKIGLRTAISRTRSNGLFSLKPVWLANPESVSQIFPVKEGQGLFDVVIFDEASQLPIEFAIPAIYRAKRVIVSGDEQQMPPSSLWGGDIEGNTEGDEDELERLQEEDAKKDDPVLKEQITVLQDSIEKRSAKDLLQIAQSVLNTRSLAVHYRSKHPELINFSNAAFYKDSLRIPASRPPDGHSEEKPLEFHQVDGLYEPKECVNPKEALAVVAAIRKLVLSGETPVPSIGVVTFNAPQRDLIGDMLVEECEKDSVFATAFHTQENRIEDGEDLGLFVKNVENVQGDERDVMIFSTTYGREAPGAPLRRRFGPLNQPNGERRLNVAITRARIRVIIYCSMPLDQISDILHAPLISASYDYVPRHFIQLYLAYAKACSDGNYDTVDQILERARRVQKGTFFGNDDHIGEPDSAFEEEVMEFLNKEGFSVIPQVNVSEFRVDLAIKHPKANRYAIGIECDGATYHSSWNARNRDIWRQKILEGFGWRIFRIWSTDWFHRRIEEQDRLLCAVRQACQDNSFKEPEKTTPNGEAQLANQSST